MQINPAGSAGDANVLSSIGEDRLDGGRYACFDRGGSRATGRPLFRLGEASSGTLSRSCRSARPARSARRTGNGISSVTSARMFRLSFVRRPTSWSAAIGSACGNVHVETRIDPLGAVPVRDVTRSRRGAGPEQVVADGLCVLGKGIRLDAVEGSLQQRFGLFAGEWRRLAGEATLEDRLRSFLPQVGALHPERFERQEIGRAPPVLSAERMQRLVKELSPYSAALRERAARPNPWTAAGLKRDEVRNTAALALLWDERRSGSAAREFLTAFLNRVSPTSSPLPLSEIFGGDYDVRVEDTPLGLASERVDLTIESDGAVLGIEVKIGAGLGEAQLERYVETIRRRAASTGRHHRVLFLAPFGPSMPEVVSASWNDVVAAARTVLPRTSARNFTHHLIDGFVEHVATWKDR